MRVRGSEDGAGECLTRASSRKRVAVRVLLSSNRIMLPSSGSPASNRPALVPAGAVPRNLPRPHNDGSATDRRTARRASDVSAGGMRVVAAAAAAVGDAVSLVFFVDGDLVAARGIVRWSVPTQHGLAMFGILFTTVDDDGPSILTTYCHAAAS